MRRLPWPAPSPLHQTVDLIRLSIEVVEQNLESILDPDDVSDVHDASSFYAREAAFATAEVYARAAEVRGAWDARLEALVVDAVLRDETDDAVLSRASAVGWGARGDVAVVLGAVPAEHTEAGVVDAVRRAARAAGMDALGAVQGHRLVVILGGVTDPEKAAACGRRPVTGTVRSWWVRSRPTWAMPTCQRSPRRQASAPPSAGRMRQDRC